jgi:two-component system chemotaxis response regulator CheY
MLKILVVEDSPTARRLIRSSLISIGYEDIFEAEDGVVALKILKTKHIDIIITDWNMPNMNSLELASIIRNDDKLFDLPIIIATTNNEKDDIQKAIKSKINGYLVKPFNSVALSKALDPLAEIIIERERKKTKNILKIEIIINGNLSLPIDEIQITKAFKSGNEPVEMVSTQIEQPSKDLIIENKIQILKNKIDFSAEFIDNENHIKEKLNM